MARKTGVGPTLRRFESNSTPGRFYDVRLGKDGVVYCTCPGWRYHRHCWHLDEVKALLRKAAA